VRAFLIATIHKGLVINGHNFISRSTHVLVSLAIRLIGAKMDNFTLNPTRVIPFRWVGIDVRRAASTWKIMMNPHDILLEDISNVFFDPVRGCPS
jgi:hypothetical protein